MGDMKILFKRAADYRIIPVTGAWGGLNPQGEIIFDLFVEKLEIESIQVRVEPDGSPVETAREGEVHVRESQIGVVVRPDIAKSIGEWLIQKANEATPRIITIKPGPGRT
jgi:hypothetical protein